MFDNSCARLSFSVAVLIHYQGGATGSSGWSWPADCSLPIPALASDRHFSPNQLQEALHMVTLLMCHSHAVS